MEIIDYYAALGVARDATTKEIKETFFDLVDKGLSPDQYALCVEAFVVLSNHYKRARYDKKLGYLLVIQVEPAVYPNAITFLIKSQQPFYGLQNVMQHMKEWVAKKLELTWQEAQEANYRCNLQQETENPYLVLHFPREIDRTQFIQLLLDEKLIKSPEKDY